MLFEHALLLIGIPLILIILGVVKNYGSMVVAGGIALLVIGVLVLASPVVANYDINLTSEDSSYWEDRCLRNLTLAAHAYCATDGDYYNSTLVSGSADDTCDLGGTQWILDEDGQMAAVLNFTTLDGTLFELLLDGHYVGPTSHNMYAWMWNWTSGNWVYMGTPVISPEGATTEYMWGITGAQSLDFRNVTDARVMFQHGINGGAFNHLFYMDRVNLLESEDDEGVVVEQYVNCTKDLVIVDYTYSGEELPANDNLIFGVMLALVGLLCLAAGAVGSKE